MKTPRVSVLMSVYNGKAYLREAVESILSQSFTDFEFIITNDGSTDGTLDILKEYAAKDKRIQIVNNPKNIGLTKSLNEAILKARGEYIARMDADDISYPDRLKLQVEFFNSHPSYGLVGAWGIEIDDKGNEVNRRKLPTKPEELMRALIIYNPFFHSSIMIRKSVFQEVGVYNGMWRYAQDYELYFRISTLYDIANLPIFLTAQRRSSLSVTESKNKEQAFFAVRARKRALQEPLYSKWAYFYLLRAYIGYLLPRWLKKLIKNI